MATRSTLTWFILFILLVANASMAGTVHQHTLKSKALEDNLININSERSVYVYVPDGYEDSKLRYPSIYYITSFNQKLDQTVVDALDDAIANGTLPPTLFVSADFAFDQGFNFFGNNEVVGRWLDFIHRDLRTWVESEYRIKGSPEHRAISGHFLGAFAAIKLAMLYPETYGSVYGLHPVATEQGDRPWVFKPDWMEIHAAQDFSQLKHPYSAPFVSMAQAHLSNPNHPPFFADFIVEKAEDELIVNVATMRKLRRNFHLGDLTPENAENLKKLRGIGFDWGRNDQNRGHVIGARNYSVLLENFGIEHVAEEHRGNGWDYDFTEGGKIRTRMLPFLGKYLKR